MTKKQKSFVPVMLTPFKPNGSIDFDGLSRLTDFYLQAGAGGLFVNCQSGEMFALSDDERIAITQHVVKVGNGAVPVVATGTFGGSIPGQADFVQRIYDTGIETVIIITNMMADASENDDVLNDRVHELLDLTGKIPIGFYECPLPYKRLLSPAQLKTFTETGRIRYHKDTCLDIDMVGAKIEATASCEQFGLYDAYMVNALDSLRAGAAGLSCIQGNYFPELVSWICKYYDDPEKAGQITMAHQFMVDNMQLMHTVYPTVAKYFLRKRGLAIETFCRVSTGVFDGQVKDAIDNLYNQYEVIREAVLYDR